MSTSNPLREQFPWSSAERPRMPRFSRHPESPPIDLTALPQTTENTISKPHDTPVPIPLATHALADLELAVSLFLSPVQSSFDLIGVVSSENSERGTIVTITLNGVGDAFLHTRVVLDEVSLEKGVTGSVRIGSLTNVMEQLGPNIRLSGFLP